MRIWIDIINTPQVSFFVPFIKDFKKEQHEVIITCRDSGNTVDLLKHHQLEFTVIGKKTGNWNKRKYFFFPKRVLGLLMHLQKSKIDIAISQSSFYQPIVAQLLNIPCLYTNDNEHARGNLFGFMLAKQVLLPVALKDEPFVKKWPLRAKVIFYPSVKEAIYLSQTPELLHKHDTKRTKIYFRPEPRTAQYYKGPLNFFDDVLLQLLNKYEVIVLPRDQSQGNYYKQDKFKKISVANKPLNLVNIVSDCMLFIGAGGSMTRELAVMGIPVISIYQEELLCVDKYLVSKGCMTVNPEVTYREIIDILEHDTETKNCWPELKDGDKSYALFRNLISNINKS